MTDERKLFSQADEFDFKRKFVIEFLAIQASQKLLAIEPFGAYFVDDAMAMADRVWDAVVEHGVNDTAQ